MNEHTEGQMATEKGQSNDIRKGRKSLLQSASLALKRPVLMNVFNNFC